MKYMPQYTSPDSDDGEGESDESTSGEDVGLSDPHEILARIERIDPDTNHSPEPSETRDGPERPQVVAPRPDRTYKCHDCGKVHDSMPYQCECGSTAFRTASDDEESHEGLVTWFTGSVARMTAPYNPYVPR